MDMVDGKDQNGLTVTVRRCYPVLLAAIAFAISGCATTVGMGQSALREGRYAEAASKFETALKEHPARTDALVGLGIARYGQARYDDALTDLNQAVSQQPTRADAQLYLGLSYLERGDEGSAAEHLRAFSDLTQSARVTEQVDAALRLMRTEHSLSPESRRFIATSLQSAMKSAQELRDARWAYPQWPYSGYYDPFFTGWRW
jgi:tetratricopeptide (TPR) repeat protein